MSYRSRAFRAEKCQAQGLSVGEDEADACKHPKFSKEKLSEFSHQQEPGCDQNEGHVPHRLRFPKSDAWQPRKTHPGIRRTRDSPPERENPGWSWPPSHGNQSNGSQDFVQYQAEDHTGLLTMAHVLPWSAYLVSALLQHGKPDKQMHGMDGQAGTQAGRQVRRQTKQPTNQPTKQTTNQPTSQPANQPANQPGNQPARQPTSHPTSQPANQPANRSGTQRWNHPSTRDRERERECVCVCVSAKRMIRKGKVEKEKECKNVNIRT